MLIMFLAFLFSPSTCSLCTCDYGERTYEEVFELNYKEADIIFIGKPVRAVGSDFRLEIIERFKGKFEEKYISGFGGSSCEEVPSNEEWIVYGNLGEDGNLIIYTCSLSRPLNSSLYLKEFVPNYPNRNDGLDASIEGLKLETLARYKSILQLQEEITELRKRRDN